MIKKKKKSKGVCICVEMKEKGQEDEIRNRRDPRQKCGLEL